MAIDATNRFDWLVGSIWEGLRIGREGLAPHDEGGAILLS